MKHSASVTINRPIDIVFDLTNNHVSEWSIMVVEEKFLEETPEVVGSTFQTLTEDRGHQMELTGTVTAYQPPNHSAVHLEGDMFNIDAVYQFEKISENETRVTQTSRVTSKGFLKVFLLLFGWLMKRSGLNGVNRELESLKAFCESYEEE
ncbi:MAG: hypothetical protein HUJ26_05580 [Planctomycetaceae bacterium]|nr:hypothetical protein [Planctomycetaceae bacterium]